jgi:hypothetical protein
VVDLRLILGEILLMAQEAICASLPVLLVAFRVLRFFGGIGGGFRSPTHSCYLPHKTEARVDLEVGRETAELHKLQQLDGQQQFVARNACAG